MKLDIAPNVERSDAYLGKILSESKPFVIIEKEGGSEAFVINKKGGLMKSLKRKYYIPINLMMNQKPSFSPSERSSLHYTFARSTNGEEKYFDLTKDEAENIYLENSTTSDDAIEKKRKEANEISSQRPEKRILLPDEEERDPIQASKFFDMEKYTEVLANIVKESNDRYSIGIYGEWGTGKTTMMKLIEKELNPIVFVWNDIGIEDTKADKDLKDILRAKYNQLIRKYAVGMDNKFKSPNWIDGAHFRKVGNSFSIITLGEERSDNNFLSITLLDNNKGDTSNIKQVILRINHQKCPYELQATYEGDRLVVRENDIITVWFNAWRYESEENFALIPLMKTIAYAMGEHPIYKNLKNMILKGLAILGKDLIRHYALQTFMTEKGIQEFEDNLTKKFAQSAEFDKDVIYFEGIKKIQEEMEKINSKKPNSKIVVFIDDLDRCSPNKALEVFESVKVFFDMPGFIFIMGLSQEALNTIIRARFQNLGLSGITPEQYLRKIIQVEVRIPKWTRECIQKLINEKICPQLDLELAKAVENAPDLIMENVLEGVDPQVGNPREVKRFINKLTIFLKSRESTNLKDYKKYLIVHALRKKWKAFYDNYFDSKLKYKRPDSKEEEFKTFPERVKEWLDLSPYEREIYLKLILEKKIGPFLVEGEAAENLLKRLPELKDLNPMSLLKEKLLKEKDPISFLKEKGLLSKKFLDEGPEYSKLKNLFNLEDEAAETLPNQLPELKGYSTISFLKEKGLLSKKFLEKRKNQKFLSKRFLDEGPEYSKLKNLFNIDPNLSKKKDRNKEDAKWLFLFNNELFWREVIAMKLEFTDESLWKFLKENKDIIFDKDLEEYKNFLESSEVVIVTPRARIDTDLVSRRRDSYLDLWPRFKLLVSDFQDVEMMYHGRPFIKTYQHIQQLFEKLQNWYFDRGGAMLMSQRTHNSYYLLQRELHRILRNNIEGDKNDEQIPPQELKSIREKVTELFNNMSEDVITNPIQ